ncbi:MAG: MTAP family purine nucleoside phosphorylase [Thaumarchaeota archaeon]|nr:MTAP family purine nucleoside phosphorylase [Nitrososphaerota archaeon]
MVIAVIAGSGMGGRFALQEKRIVKTEYGQVLTYHAIIGARKFWVLPRHGLDHVVPPHRINYRANIAALRKLGVKNVIATSAVGSLNPKFRVGDLGLVEQFLDFTKSRASTFFDDRVVHTDMTHPYNARLNREIQKTGSALGLVVRPGLVYACAEGPRFETAAEIKMYRSLGADVVGMTGVPEVVLANEIGLRYSSLVVATNSAAGIQERVKHEEVLTVMDRAGPKVKRLIENTITRID